eukprot:3735372-Prymnesium_polylepis.1
MGGGVRVTCSAAHQSSRHAENAAVSCGRERRAPALRIKFIWRRCSDHSSCHADQPCTPGESRRRHRRGARE